MRDSWEFAELPELRCGKILLRKLRLADTRALWECLSDPVLTERMMHRRVPSLAAMEERVRAYLREYETHANARFGAVSVEDGRLIGSAMLTPVQHPARAVLGFYVNRSCWGRGYARDMVSAILRFGFEQAGMNRIEGTCFVENTASARVMERCGMQCEGLAEDYYYVNGKLRDVRRFALLRRDWEKWNGTGDAAR